MNVKYPFAAILLACAAVVSAQPAKPRPEFEVASVKAAPPYDAMSGQKMNIGVRIDGAQVHFSNFTLKDYIRIAFKVKLHQIVGPDWINSDRWNIDAKLPPGSSQPDVLEMLQSLLQDRFQMKYHREPRDFAVYGLVVTKGGAKMQEEPPDPEAEGEDPAKTPFSMDAQGGPNGTTVTFGKGSFFFGDNRFEGKKLDMTSFADVLGRFVDRPVVDMTELKGKYNFTLKFSEEDYRAMLIRSAVAAGINLPPQALQLLQGTTDDGLAAALQSIGLKLDKRKAPIEVIVIDSAVKTPTEN